MKPIRFAVLGILLAVSSTLAVAPGQVDDFEDGTTLGWTEGASSPNDPVNEPDGGPAGVGDAYLRNVSTGIVGPGGRMVQYNQTRWKGNYVLAGVTHVRMDVANFGTTPLHLRIGFEGQSTYFVSRLPVDVPPDGTWREATFDVRDLSHIGGTATLDEVLAKVTTLRIHSADSTAWTGDQIDGVMGLDNITAVAGGMPVEPATWGRLKTLYP